MEYLDSHERFAQIQDIMQRYAKMGRKFEGLVRAPSPADEATARVMVVRGLSVLDLMKCHLDTAIAEAEKLDDEMFQMVNSTKEQALSELRVMLKALTAQIAYMDKEITRLRTSSKE